MPNLQHIDASQAEVALIEGEEVTITSPVVITAKLSDLEEQKADAEARLASYDAELQYILDAQIARHTSEFERGNGTKAALEAEVARLASLIGKATTAGAVVPVAIVEAPIAEEEVIIP